MIIKPPIRGQDDYGSGAYLASRGKRKHNGIDYCCYPNSRIISPVDGIVSKVGHAYGDDLSFRYVEIKTDDEIFVRVFYIEPSVAKGYRVTKTSLLGLSQTLQVRYPADEKHKNAITDHIHVECFRLKDGKKNYINPLEYLT